MTNSNISNDCTGSSEPVLASSPFFCLPNHSSHAVTRRELERLPETPYFATKAEYREYCCKPTTQDCFFSCYQGEQPGVRVSVSNPPVFLYGLVADYDAPMDEERRNKALAKMRIRPTHVSESYSQGTHAVWLFERPIPLVDANSTHELLSIAYKELRLGSAFGPLDETAFFTTAQYYHRGWRWRETGGKPIPLERLMLWQAKAWKKAAWCSLGQEIPLSRVAEEVEA